MGWCAIGVMGGLIVAVLVGMLVGRVGFFEPDWMTQQEHRKMQIETLDRIADAVEDAVEKESEPASTSVGDIDLNWAPLPADARQAIRDTSIRIDKNGFVEAIEKVAE